jgi:hypothetical protein
VLRRAGAWPSVTTRRRSCEVSHAARGGMTFLADRPASSRHGQRQRLTD